MTRESQKMVQESRDRVDAIRGWCAHVFPDHTDSRWGPHAGLVGAAMTLRYQHGPGVVTPPMVLERAARRYPELKQAPGQTVIDFEALALA